MDSIMSKYLRTEQLKQEMLADPSKIDNMVADIAMDMSPTVVKPSTKFSRKVDAVDASIPSNHPMKGYATELRDNVTKALAHPSFSGYSPAEIASAYAKQGLATPTSTGETRWEGSYRKKREADAAWFGLFGSDEKVKKLPGYDEWLANKRVDEDRRLANEDYLASIGDVAQAGAEGAVWGGAAGAIFGGLPGAAPGAAGGAALWAAMEPIAHPIRRLLHGTEWYRSKEASPELGEKAKLFAVDALPYVAADLGIRKVGSTIVRGAVKQALGMEAEGLVGSVVQGAAEESGLAGLFKSRVSVDAAQSMKGYLDRGLPKGSSDLTADLTDFTTAVLGRESALATLGSRPSATNFLKYVEADAASKAAEGRFAETMSLKSGREKVFTLAEATGKVNDELTGGLLAEIAPGMSSKLPARPESLVNVAGWKPESWKTPVGAVVSEDVPSLRTGPKFDSEAYWYDKFKIKLPKKPVDLTDPNIMSPEGFDRVIASGDVNKAAPIIAEGEMAVKRANAKEKFLTLRDKGQAIEQGLVEPAKVRGPEYSIDIEGNVVNYRDKEYNIGKTWYEQATRARAELDAKIQKRSSALAKGYERSSLTPKPTRTFVGEPVPMEPVAKSARESADVFAQEIADMQSIGGSKLLKDKLTAEQFAGPAAEGMTLEDKLRFVDENSKFLDEIKGKHPDLPEDMKDPKQWSFLKNGLVGIAGLAVSVPVIGTLLTPSEADAGMIPPGTIPSVIAAMASDTVKAGKLSRTQVVRDLFDSNFVNRGVDPNNPYKLPTAQEGLDLAKDAGREFKKGVSGAVMRTTKLPLSLEQKLSPHVWGDVYYKTGFNPGVELGSRQMAIIGNTDNAMKVTDNILNAHPEIVSQGRGVLKEIDKAMKPLQEEFKAQVEAYRALDGKVFAYETKILPRLEKKLKTDPTFAEKAQAIRDELQQTIEARDALNPKMEKFSADWEANAKLLTDKYARSRVALAAEDTADFQKYPWLKDKLTYDDKIAVARIKEFHQDYAIRLQATEHAVLDEPYLHHAWPSSWRAPGDAAEVLKTLNADAASALPFSKFFQRSKYSKMMVLDPEYNMKKYIPDAEKRIQISQFWGKKGDPDSWRGHMNSDIVKSNPALRDYWNKIKDSFAPMEQTTVNNALNRYAAIETLRLIGFAGSTALKHLFKVPGTMGSLGVGNVLKSVPEAVRVTVRSNLQNSVDRGFLKSIGIRNFNSGESGKMWNQLTNTFITRSNYQNILNELDMPLAGKFDKMMWKVNDVASLPISTVERFDRTASYMAALNMAAKQGMTAKQAAYGVYDTILKNNFLGGFSSPNWIRDPKVRALFLFQSTPFKIWERRLLYAYKTGKALGKAYDVIPGKGAAEKLQQLAGVKNFIREGETEFKKHMIVDALKSESDIFGTPYSKQFMKEILIAGSIMAGGSALELNLKPQVGHIPFLRGETRDPVLSVSPIVGGAFETLGKRSTKAAEGEDQNFIVSDFLQNWLGRNHVIPLTIHKALRISDGDIPERYKDSSLQYFFSVPSSE